MKRLFRPILVIALAIVGLSPAQAGSSWREKVSSTVLEALAQGETDFLVVLNEQADLSATARLATKEEKGAYVYQALTTSAARSQQPLLNALMRQNVEYRAYWIANLIWVRGDAEVLESLAQRPEVAYIAANPAVMLDLPSQPPALTIPEHPTAVEWNISRVNADDVWGAGYTGQNVVVAGQDTGYDWDHPALINQYRGWSGSSADHDYNWHDAIHTTIGSSCGVDSPIPCDDHGHGTHTMGTMIGDDSSGNQIGMAPGARWIGCRNMDVGIGTPETYIECFQWFMAPTRIDGSDPRPDLAPDVINNSWGCPPSEGCDAEAIEAMQTVVENVRAAGIMVVASAGNSGNSCGSVNDPPAIYDATFTVGNTTSSDTISNSSSRGPAAYTGLLKPDISAPGTGIRSSADGGGYRSMSGTSMASPHVVGEVALLISAFPNLRGDVDTLETIIRNSALHLTSSENCGGIPGSSIPNNTYGWGRIDAWEAYQLIDANGLTISKQAPATVLPGQSIDYTLTVTNTSPLSIHAVILTDTLPVDTIFITATLPYTLTGNTIEWSFENLSSGETRSVNLTVRPLENRATRQVINEQYSASSIEITQTIGGGPVSTQILDLLTLSKQAPAWVTESHPITYTLTITNESSTTPTSPLVLTDTLPTDTTFITATLPHTLTKNTIEWNIGNLSPGEAHSVHLVVQPGVSREISNEHYGIYSLEIPQAISGQPVITHILDQLTLSKQAPAWVAAETPITYTLTVTNNLLNIPTTNLIVTDTLPAHTNLVSATLPYTIADDVIKWTFDSIPAGEAHSIKLVVEPDANVAKEIVNEYYGVRSIEMTQTITGPPVTTRILERLSLSKQAPSHARPGDLITYTLTITNNHINTPTTSLILTDTIPTNTFFLAASLPYTRSGDLLEWHFAELAPGEFQTVAFTVQTPITFTGAIINSQYALRTTDFSIEVTAPPVITRIARDYFLPIILRASNNRLQRSTKMHFPKK